MYRPGGAVDVASTLRPLQRGSGDPAFQVAGGVVWLALCTPSGPASVAIRRAGDTIAVSAWGSGAAWAVEHAPDLLGRGDDWSSFDVSGHEFLAEARHRQPGLRLLRTNTVVAMLVPAIMEQKVTSRQAWGAWRYLLRRHGTPAPGPAPAGMMVPPDAPTWARIPSWEWHRAGIEPGRSATVMRAVKLAPALERTLAHGRGGAEVSAKLQSIPGVGRWTAAETAQRSHGDPDSPSVGDFHVPALVGWALTGAPVDDDGMLELLEPWRGHRERVVRLIGGSGFRKPAFGPRITIQDHRGH
ncbi:DNA-3-methyladenine glycosylase 2 family protein [Curtobacterium flaccumfaciens pv. flaccumfaciens]|nr:DNA-3-methyladenine glycosylase 2 family protein [Curtobacterium flaccumfaciens]MBT1675939.1 DNA-3-methyladenine glycosylase 2 family protein [Curtobacterium flaccumfaciens pv. flaccumfaciens]